MRIFDMQNRRKFYRTKAQRERASERTRRGWDTRRANGTATWGSDDRPPDRVPAGEFLGALVWQAASGEVIKCVVRQGARANGIRIGKTECGWDFLTRRMRKALARPRRVERVEGAAV